MIKIFEWLLPSLPNWQMNKKIRKKIEENNGINKPSEKVSIEKLTNDQLEKIYETELAAKDKFEDKAKTNVIGVTISVTLILGAYSLLQNIMEKHGIGSLYIIALVLFVISVIYMLAAGVHAIHLLVAENTIHIPSIGLVGNEHINDLDNTIGLNRARNLIRNNYIFTSYECIRNALICLFLVMVIAIIPFHSNDRKTEPAHLENYYFSSDAMQSITNGADLSIVQNYINTQPPQKGIISVVDEKDRLFIKYSIDDDNNIIVYLIEPY